MNKDESARNIFVAGKSGSLVCAAFEDVRSTILNNGLETII